MPSSTPWDSGGTYACLPNGAIDPSLIPIPDVDPDELETTATMLTGVGGDIGQSGTDITTSWAGLSGVYIAPEADTLFAKMDPVGSETSDVQEAVATVSGALATFAEDAREIKARLVSLKGRAEELRAEIGTDEDWAEDDELRERNNFLNNEVADAVFDYQYAERNCANKITGLFGGTYFAGRSELSPENPGTTSDGRESVYYGTFKPLVDTANPWGSPVDAPPAGGILGDGLAALGGLGAGAALGLGAATGLYRDGRAAYPFGSEWQQNMGAYFGELKEGYSTLTGFYVDGQWTSHDSVDEWYSHFREAAGGVLGSYVAYDQWEDRPAYSITTGVANTALLVLGGAGAVKLLFDDVRVSGGPDGGPSGPDPGNGTSHGGHPWRAGERPGDSPHPGQDGFGEGNNGTPSLDDVQRTLNELGDLNGTDRSSGPSVAGTGGTDPGAPHGQSASGADTGAPAASSTTPDAPSGGGSSDPWTAAPVHGTDPSSSRPATGGSGDGADSSAHPVNAGGGSNGSVPAVLAGGPDGHGGGTNPGGPNGSVPVDADRGSGSDGGNGGGDSQAATGGQDQGGGQQSATGSGSGTASTDSTATPPGPAPLPDPTTSYPGRVDAEGIRRFADETEVDAYAQQVLLDPSANPHAFDNLPAEQRELVHGYTRNSWINSMARAGSPAEVQGILDRMVDYTLNRSAAGDAASVGWELYELNGRVRPTLGDLSAASSRTDLTANQRVLIRDIFSDIDPAARLDHWLRSSGYAGLVADMNSGSYPDASGVGALMSELDRAVDRPLPESVELVRGMHSLDHMSGFDPSDMNSLVGVLQVEQGYMSTSLGSKPTTVDGRGFPYVMNMTFSGEARGLWVGTRSAYPFQRELILPRGTQYKVEGVRFDGVKYILDVHVL